MHGSMGGGRKPGDSRQRRATPGASRLPDRQRGWAPFKSGRSNIKGKFTIRFPISKGSAGLTYRVRIKVPTQAGWGFRAATSRTMRFHVS